MKFKVDFVVIKIFNVLEQLSIQKVGDGINLSGYE